MSTTRSERSIDSDISASGRRLLSDITASNVWADSTLQYYLGGQSALQFDSEFQGDIPTFFTGGVTDNAYAYVNQTVRSFEMIDSVIATDFQRVTNENTARNQADLVIVSHRDTSTGLEGFFNFPGSQTRSGSDDWSLGVMNSGNSLLNATPERGGGEYLYWTVIHEIGHGLGLEHPHTGAATNVRASVGEAMNNERYTVMSYSGASDANTYGHAVGMMALDIAALQQQYGAESYATGNSTYTLFDARGTDLRLAEGDVHIGRAYFSIWDSGGTDTINYGSSTNSVLINLNDATLDRDRVAADAAPSIEALQNTQFYRSLSTNVQNETIDSDYHAGGFFSRVLIQSGTRYNGIDGGFSIANGADIENATGGVQEDLLIGNELNNVLTGAGGNDVLIGGGGNDTLEGGIGNDTAAYAGNRSQYTVEAIADGYRVVGGNEGGDILNEVEFAQFNDQLLDLSTITGAAEGQNLTGAGGADTLRGGAGDDTLTGLSGNDILIGLDGDDTLEGGNQDDHLAGDALLQPIASSGSRLPLGQTGLIDFSRTVDVPTAIRANYVATRADAGFTLTADSDVGSTSTTIPHLTAGYSITQAGYVYLALDVVNGERIIVDIDYMAGADGGTGRDSYLRVFDANGTLITENDDRASSADDASNENNVGGRGSLQRLDSFLDFTASDTGTYFVEVATYDPNGARSPIAANTQFEINLSQNFSTNGSIDGGTSNFAGNDRLLGGAGNDTLEGGDGADTLNAGSGDDLIFGGATEADLRDVVFGGDGNDTINGGYGNDELRGDAGNDLVNGDFGADTVIAGAGNDTLTGAAFSDLMFGGDGNDFVNGGFGSDRVNGGNGADNFYHLGVADHGNDWIQDYSSAEGDRLVYGGAANTGINQFQINLATTAQAGVDGVQEAFVIYRPTGQILWALVDGGGQQEINLRIGNTVYDLMEA